MPKKYARILCIVAATVLIVINLVGCSQPKDKSTDGTGDTSSENNLPSTTATAGTGDTSTGNSLPIVKEPITLKYWVGFNGSALKVLKNYNECAAYQELEKRTGIHIDFIHPPVGQEKEQYQLMIASNDLTDIIEEYWNATYPGGPDKAISDGIYLKLNDYIDKYAPNYKKLIAANKGVAKQTITDAGNMWFFGAVTVDKTASWSGPVFRKDWLDELGLQAPTTISEWYTVLKAFKQKGVEAPYLLDSRGYPDYGSVIGAYGVGAWFYQVDNKVKYGPIEQGYKDYLTEMNKWYKEGLIDKDFATRDRKAEDAMAISGKAGAWVGNYGQRIDTYMTAQKDDKNYALVAAPNPSLKPEDIPHFRQQDMPVSGAYKAVITTACKYPVEAVKWMDYHYGEEGSRLFNWGVEDLSYKMVNGKPEFTEAVTKDPGGLPYDIINWKYKVHNGPYLVDPTATPPYSKETEIAREVWTKAINDYALPSTNMLPEESSEYSSIMSSINTLVSQMRLKFIIGSEPLSKFDEYVNQVKKMNIERAIQLQQAALDRYNKK